MVSAADKDEVVTESGTESGGCCSSKQPEAVEQLSLGQKLLSAVQYGYGRMISDTAKWLVIGLVAATIITAVVPQSFFLRWGDGHLYWYINFAEVGLRIQQGNDRKSFE